MFSPAHWPVFRLLVQYHQLGKTLLTDSSEMGVKGVAPQRLSSLCSTPRDIWAAQIEVDVYFKKKRKDRS